MEAIDENRTKKKNLIIKTWERCKSMGRNRYLQRRATSIYNLSSSTASIPKLPTATGKSLSKSQSWAGFETLTSSPTPIDHNGHHHHHRNLVRRRSSSGTQQQKQQQPATPSGCFSVYVGPDKQRFVIKAKSANHPLFKELLEEAESEYGYSCMGPLMLPCEVDVFIKVLFEMEQPSDNDNYQYGCVPKSPKSYRMLSPFRNGMVTMNQYD